MTHPKDVTLSELRRHEQIELSLAALPVYSLLELQFQMFIPVFG